MLSLKEIVTILLNLIRGSYCMYRLLDRDFNMHQWFGILFHHIYRGVDLYIWKRCQIEEQKALFYFCLNCLLVLLIALYYLVELASTYT